GPGPLRRPARRGRGQAAPMTILLVLAVLGLAAVGTPIFAMIGGLAIYLFHAAQSPEPGLSVITELMRLATMPSLIAVPLFTFAGYVLAESKSPQRLVDLAE